MSIFMNKDPAKTISKTAISLDIGKQIIKKNRHNNKKLHQN